MGQFVFYAAAQAYYSPSRDAFPMKGVRDYGDLVHRYQIPMTWLTNAEGARRGKSLFTEFHETYGDDVIFWGMPGEGATTGAKRDANLPLTEEEVSAYIQRETAAIRAALPFARTDHAAFFYRTTPVVRAAAAAGIQSLYGHCWEMVATDGVTDNGTPWGFYYLDEEVSWKRPRQTGSRGIVANEWLQHDLCKSWRFHGSCSVFSWDPNDVGRAGICDAREIEYWKRGFEEYYRNRSWNDFIPFVLHQEAHEMQAEPDWGLVYDAATVVNTFEMVDEFLAFITGGGFPEMQILTLPQAVDAYRAAAPDGTLPTHMLFRDLPLTNPRWVQAKTEVQAIVAEARAEALEEDEWFDAYALGPYLPHYGWQGMLQGDVAYPEAFVVCDRECELFYERGRTEPVKEWNYLIPVDPAPRNLYFNELIFRDDLLPAAHIDGHSCGEVWAGNPIAIHLVSPAEKPYGLCLWGDFSSFESGIVFEGAKQCTAKVVGTHLLFLRFRLTPGLTHLEVRRE
jgi:hypothetical protein